MSILLVCLAVALLTSELGMSLAFGAFLGGLMISRSEYSQDAFSHVLPFKDTFTSFFFVSIGMMLDLSFVFDHILLITATVLLVLTLKSLVAGGTAFLLGHTFRGTVVVGLALAQIGEFSFILANENIPQALGNWMIGQGLGMITFLLACNVILLVAGNFMEPSSIVLIFAPDSVSRRNAAGH